MTLHEDGLHSCGHPRGLAFEDFNEGIFEVREQVCQACAAMDVWRQQQDGKNRQPGITVGVANTLRAGEDFRIWQGSGASVQAHGGQGHAHDPDEHRDGRDLPTAADPTDHD